VAMLGNGVREISFQLKQDIAARDFLSIGKYGYRSDGREDGYCKD